MRDYIHTLNKAVEPFNAALLPYLPYFIRVSSLMSIALPLKDPSIATTNEEKGRYVGMFIPITLILTELIFIPKEFKDPYNLLIIEKLSRCSIVESGPIICCSILLPGLLGNYIGRKFDPPLPLPAQLQN